MSRVISPEGLPVASGLSREACQRIAAELGDGYTVETRSAQTTRNPADWLLMRKRTPGYRRWYPGTKKVTK